MSEWELFDPPPQTFPGANVYIAQYMRCRIRPLRRSESLKDWNNSNKHLSTIIGGSAADDGKIIHVWKTPWEFYDDGFAVITYWDEGPPAFYQISGLVLNTHVDWYYYTIGEDVPLSLHALWNGFFTEIGGIPPGGIRWGKLWLETNLLKITHSITNVHWDGPP